MQLSQSSDHLKLVRTHKAYCLLCHSRHSVCNTEFRYDPCCWCRLRLKANTIQKAYINFKKNKYIKFWVSKIITTKLMMVF